jgi:hypothetical protein
VLENGTPGSVRGALGNWRPYRDGGPNYPGEYEVQSEVITIRDDLMIRRLVLEPGETMPWHTDSCHRFSVVVRGQQLTIEFRDTGEEIAVPVYPGMVGWDEPTARVHRAVNTGSTTYEEVVTFFLSFPGTVPQPEYP